MRALERGREAALSTLAGVSAVGVGLATLLVVASGGRRLAAVVVGGIGFLAACYVTRNARLVCLWGFMATLSLNISRKLTAYSDRGGGATGVQIELCDPLWAALGLFLAWDVLAGRRRMIRVPKVVWVWGLIMLLGMVTVLTGQWRRVAAYEVIRMAKMALMFLVLVNELERPRQLIHAGAGLALGVLAQGVVAVLQFVKGGSLGLEFLGETAEKTTQQLAESSVVGQEIWRVSGLLLHPNLLGVFLAAAIPVCVGLFLTPIGRGLRAACLVTAGVATVALVATFSRSSWVSFAAAMAVFGGLTLAHGQMRRRSLMPAVAAAAALGLVLVVFAGPISTRLFASKADATDARERFKEEAGRLIAEKPVFGWGMNAYVDEVLAFSDFSRASYGGWVPPVHNIYYLWTADLGVVGLVLHLWVIAWLVWVGVGNLGIRHPLMYTLNAACLGAMAAFVVDGNFSFSLRVDQILREFWVLAAVLCAVRSWRVRGEAALTPTEPDAGGVLPDARGLFGTRGEGIGGRLGGRLHESTTPRDGEWA